MERGRSDPPPRPGHHNPGDPHRPRDNQGLQQANPASSEVTVLFRDGDLSITRGGATLPTIKADMTDELRKRIEEAADEYAYGRHSCITAGNGFIAGAEFGYKEAIAQAKEWLETNIANQVEMMCAEGPLMMSKKAFLADFETDITKLWEEQK